MQAENTKGLNRGYTSWFNWSRVSKDTKSITPIGKYLRLLLLKRLIYFIHILYIYIRGGQTKSHELYATRIPTFLQTIFLI